MISRRKFLQLSALAGISALATACQQPAQLEWIFGHIRPTRPEISQWRDNPAAMRAARLLNRIAYGPRPGDIERVVKKGLDNFIDEQLSPETIADQQAFWLARRIETLNLKAPDIFSLSADEAIGDLRRAMILRAIYSERQLLEIMVEFWNDHFNIYAGKSDCAWLKVIDDREAIRPHALGNFRDLLRASATSAAMLVYLDGRVNQRGKPNENYARELMELHTLGVNGGYQQIDVMEAARALTGWQVKEHFWRGQIRFNKSEHAEGAKSILGCKIDAGNESDLDQLIDVVSKHPSTAQFISWKLARRFVCDQPDTQLVDRIARRFQESGGNIKETLSELLHSQEFQQAPRKFKRPYTYAISALRALGAVSDGGNPMQEHLRAMGQLPWNWPTPDGYPEDQEHWQAQLLTRWNFALALANNQINGTKVDLSGLVDAPKEFAPALLQRDLKAAEWRALDKTKSGNEAIALLLCLPDYQFQ